jgi:hypothetical protein
MKQLLCALMLGIVSFGIVSCGGGGSSSSSQPKAAVSVSITPNAPTINAGLSVTLTASVANTTNGNVTWTVQEGPTGGAITSAGTYTASASAGTFHVIATSVADSTKSASVAVTVLPAVSVSITPGAPTIIVGQSVKLTDAVANTTSTGVTWAVQETAGGTIAADGTYTAPMKAGTYHAAAVSQLDPRASALAAITVTAPTPVFSSGATLSAAEGQPYSYSVTATDPAGTPLTYALATKPDGAVVSGNVISWTPARTQARSSNAFTVTVSSAAGGSASQSWSVSPTGIIQGSQVQSYIVESGAVSNKPVDLTSAQIAAYVPTGSTYLAPLPGTGLADGSFTIPNVPAGGFYIKLNDAFYWTTQNTIDLGWDALGRMDAQQAVNPPVLSLNVASPLPLLWHLSDELQVYTANLSFYDLGDCPFTQPEDTFSWSDSWNTLPSAATDTTYIYQLTSRPTTAGSKLLALAASTSMPLTLLDGVNASYPVELSPVDSTSNFHLNVAGSALAAIRPGISTNASPDGTYAALDAMPTGASRGVTGITPDLVILLNAQMSSDTDFGDVSYGNPFPATWAPFVDLADQVYVNYSVPNTSTKVRVVGINSTQTTTMPSASNPIAPLIGSVSNPTIGGMNFHDDLQNVGTTPTLSWQPPTLGSPTSYVIRLYEIRANSVGGYSAYTVATFSTTQQSFTIPDGYMQAGKMNFFRIMAMYRPSVDFESQPRRAGFPNASADAFSGLIIP